jgi:DNA-binding beta-propeller fold protein YncE
MKSIRFFLSVLLPCVISACHENSQTPQQPSTLYFADWLGKQAVAVDVSNPHQYSVIANAAHDALGETGAIAVDFVHNYLYLTEERKNRILRKNLDGSGTMEVLYESIDGIDAPSAIELDVANDRIYWINAKSNQIMRGSTDGTEPPKVMHFGNVKAISYSYSFAIDLKNRKLYVADYDYGILVGNLDGEALMEKLYPVGKANVYKPVGLVLDVGGNKIYWADEFTKNILVAPLDGSGTPVTLIDVGNGTSNYPTALAIDKIDGRIYWAEYPSNIVAYQQLDGTGPRSVLLEGVESYCLRLNDR